jgi:hypothetical protein
VHFLWKQLKTERMHEEVSSMARSLMVQDILDEVEFEIAQGVITTGELGDGVQAVRQYQNKLRAETFKSMKATDPRRELLSRQFQVNDMLINLLQEMVLTLETTRVELQKLYSRAPQATATKAGPETPELRNARMEPVALEMVGEDLPDRSSEEVERAMQPEAIEIDLQARPFHWPIIGWLLTRLRIFYQRPALFYTRLFANRQAPINRVFGDHILQLEALLRLQQRQIHALSAQLQDGSEDQADEANGADQEDDGELA